MFNLCSSRFMIAVLRHETSVNPVRTVRTFQLAIRRVGVFVSFIYEPGAWSNDQLVKLITFSSRHPLEQDDRSESVTYWLGAAQLKHGASPYLKFEGLKLSVVIIFNTFHWLKHDESYSVVSVALLCVSLLPLCQRKVILYCCETTFLIIAELTHNLTYQIIVSPIPSIPDFVYSHFAQKII